MRSPMRVVAALVVVLLAAGCVQASVGSTPATPPARLGIHNLAFANVVVYLITAPGGESTTRLATVTGFSKGSAVVPVSPGEHVMLHVNVDASGNMSQTQLYPAADADSGAVSRGPLPGQARRNASTPF